MGVVNLDGNLFCCLSQEQQEEIKADIRNKDFQTVYHYQENLIKGKTGYRCSVCGEFYPYLRIKYENKLIAPEDISKLKGEQKKYKKASTVFCNDHYYAQNKKTLLKFECDTEQNMQQTDVIPIMGEVYHTIMSLDEKFIATETFKGTLAIVDVSTKQMIAKKQKCKINGSFIFSEENKLLYFFEDAIRYWDFIENKDKVIWKVPEEWKKMDDREILDKYYKIAKQDGHEECIDKTLEVLPDDEYANSIKDKIVEAIGEEPETKSEPCEVKRDMEQEFYFIGTKDGFAKAIQEESPYERKICEECDGVWITELENICVSFRGSRKGNYYKIPAHFMIDQKLKELFEKNQITGYEH